MKIKNIKFKAKRLDGKGWAIGDLLHSYENGAIIVPIEGGGAFFIRRNGTENSYIYIYICSSLQKKINVLLF